VGRELTYKDGTLTEGVHRVIFKKDKTVHPLSAVLYIFFPEFFLYHVESACDLFKF
jgi:hypothetical protein